jgi:hypothetical protein
VLSIEGKYLQLMYRKLQNQGELNIKNAFKETILAWRRANLELALGKFKN